MKTKGYALGQFVTENISCLRLISNIISSHLTCLNTGNVCGSVPGSVGAVMQFIFAVAAAEEAARGEGVLFIAAAG